MFAATRLLAIQYPIPVPFVTASLSISYLQTT